MNLLSILNFENLTEGIIVTIIGFGIVFAVLIFICIMLMISGKLLSVKPEAASSKVLTVPEKAKAAVEEKGETDDKEIVAVIAAAISAYEGKHISPDRLVVRRLKRVSSWSKEAIAEQQGRLF